MSERLQKLELTWFNKDKALIPAEEGKYDYTWVDPKDPRYCETHTLVIDEKIHGEQSLEEEGVTYSDRADWEPTDDNLLIHGESGDVLEALTRVPELAAKYVGQVKCVYIDPPFNTEQAFPDYEDNLEHSIWLTLMRDRLVHLHKLLRSDGSIWVHLDSKENHRMRLLLDEVFGAGNFVTELAWEKVSAPSNNSNSIPMVTDSIVVYAKSSAFSRNRLPRKASMDIDYTNPDGDPKGRWTTGDPCARHNAGRRQHPGVYGIQHPITGEMIYPPSTANWRLEQKTILSILQGWGRYEYGDITEAEWEQRGRIEGANVELREDVKPLIIKGWSDQDADRAQEAYNAGNWPRLMLTDKGKGGFRLKRYLAEVQGVVPGNLFRWRDAGLSDSAKKHLQKLFPDKRVFTTPKPEKLLARILQIATDPGDLVLDIFAGSGTTAAVAQKLGRRWVTCELIEDTVRNFTKPRLMKTINDTDPGGVTFTEERAPGQGVEVPESHSAEDLKEAASVLNAVMKSENLSDKDRDILKAAKKLIATKPVKIVNWRGGGGFQVAHLSPVCFDYDSELGLVTLTEAATGRTLTESVAANLNFHLTPEHRHFHGMRGAMRLVVVEGRLDRDKVDDLIAHLDEEDGLTVAATEIDDGIRQYLRSLGRGCRAVHIPNDIFTYTASEEN